MIAMLYVGNNPNIIRDILAGVFDILALKSPQSKILPSFWYLIIFFSIQSRISCLRLWVYAEQLGG
jgi:hypothetical protein